MSREWHQSTYEDLLNEICRLEKETDKDIDLSKSLAELVTRHKDELCAPLRFSTRTSTTTRDSLITFYKSSVGDPQQDVEKQRAMNFIVTSAVAVSEIIGLSGEDSVRLVKGMWKATKMRASRQHELHVIMRSAVEKFYNELYFRVRCLREILEVILTNPVELGCRSLDLLLKDPAAWRDQKFRISCRVEPLVGTAVLFLLEGGNLIDNLIEGLQNILRLGTAVPSGTTEMRNIRTGSMGRLNQVISVAAECLLLTLNVFHTPVESVKKLLVLLPQCASDLESAGCLPQQSQPSSSAAAAAGGGGDALPYAETATAEDWDGKVALTGEVPENKKLSFSLYCALFLSLMPPHGGEGDRDRLGDGTGGRRPALKIPKWDHPSAQHVQAAQAELQKKMSPERSRSSPAASPDPPPQFPPEPCGNPIYRENTGGRGGAAQGPSLPLPGGVAAAAAAAAPAAAQSSASGTALWDAVQKAGFWHSTSLWGQFGWWLVQNVFQVTDKSLTMLLPRGGGDVGRLYGPAESALRSGGALGLVRAEEKERERRSRKEVPAREKHLELLEDLFLSGLDANHSGSRIILLLAQTVIRIGEWNGALLGRFGASQWLSGVRDGTLQGCILSNWLPGVFLIDLGHIETRQGGDLRRIEVFDIHKKNSPLRAAKDCWFTSPCVTLREYLQGSAAMGYSYGDAFDTDGGSEGIGSAQVTVVYASLVRLVNRLCRVLPSACSSVSNFLFKSLDDLVFSADIGGGPLGGPSGGMVAGRGVGGFGGSTTLPRLPRLYSELLDLSAVVCAYGPLEIANEIAHRLAAPHQGASQSWLYFPTAFQNVLKALERIAQGGFGFSLGIDGPGGEWGDGGDGSLGSLFGRGGEREESDAEKVLILLESLTGLVRLAGAFHTTRLFRLLPPPPPLTPAVAQNADPETLLKILSWNAENFSVPQSTGGDEATTEDVLIGLKASCLETLSTFALSPPSARTVLYGIIGSIGVLRQHFAPERLKYAMQAPSWRRLEGMSRLLISLFSAVLSILHLFGYRSRYSFPLREVTDLVFWTLHLLSIDGVGTEEERNASGPRGRVVGGGRRTVASNVPTFGFFLQRSWPTRYWRLASVVLRVLRLLLRGPLPLTGEIRSDMASRSAFKSSNFRMSLCCEEMTNKELLAQSATAAGLHSLASSLRSPMSFSQPHLAQMGMGEDTFADGSATMDAFLRLLTLNSPSMKTLLSLITFHSEGGTALMQAGQGFMPRKYGIMDVASVGLDLICLLLSRDVYFIPAYRSFYKVVQVTERGGAGSKELSSLPPPSSLRTTDEFLLENYSDEALGRRGSYSVGAGVSRDPWGGGAEEGGGASRVGARPSSCAALNHLCSLMDNDIGPSIRRSLTFILIQVNARQPQRTLCALADDAFTLRQVCRGINGLLQAHAAGPGTDPLVFFGEPSKQLSSYRTKKFTDLWELLNKKPTPFAKTNCPPPAEVLIDPCVGESVALLLTPVSDRNVERSTPGVGLSALRSNENTSLDWRREWVAFDQENFEADTSECESRSGTVRGFFLPGRQGGACGAVMFAELEERINCLETTVVSAQDSEFFGLFVNSSTDDEEVEVSAEEVNRVRAVEMRDALSVMASASSFVTLGLQTDDVVHLPPPIVTLPIPPRYSLSSTLLALELLSSPDPFQRISSFDPKAVPSLCERVQLGPLSGTRRVPSLGHKLFGFKVKADLGPRPSSLSPMGIDGVSPGWQICQYVLAFLTGFSIQTAATSTWPLRPPAPSDPNPTEAELAFWDTNSRESFLQRLQLQAEMTNAYKLVAALASHPQTCMATMAEFQKSSGRFGTLFELVTLDWKRVHPAFRPLLLGQITSLCQILSIEIGLSLQAPTGGTAPAVCPFSNDDARSLRVIRESIADIISSLALGPADKYARQHLSGGTLIVAALRNMCETFQFAITDGAEVPLQDLPESTIKTHAVIRLLRLATRPVFVPSFDASKSFSPLRFATVPTFSTRALLSVLRTEDPLALNPSSAYGGLGGGIEMGMYGGHGPKVLDHATVCGLVQSFPRTNFALVLRAQALSTLSALHLFFIASAEHAFSVPSSALRDRPFQAVAAHAEAVLDALSPSLVRVDDLVHPEDRDASALSTQKLNEVERERRRRNLTEILQEGAYTRDAILQKPKGGAEPFLGEDLGVRNRLLALTSWLHKILKAMRSDVCKDKVASGVALRQDFFQAIARALCDFICHSGSSRPVRGTIYACLLELIRADSSLGKGQLGTALVKELRRFEEAGGGVKDAVCILLCDAAVDDALPPVGGSKAHSVLPLLPRPTAMSQVLGTADSLLKGQRLYGTAGEPLLSAPVEIPEGSLGHLAADEELACASYSPLSFSGLLGPVSPGDGSGRDGGGDRLSAPLMRGVAGLAVQFLCHLVGGAQASDLDALVGLTAGVAVGEIPQINSAVRSPRFASWDALFRSRLGNLWKFVGRGGELSGGSGQSSYSQQSHPSPTKRPRVGISVQREGEQEKGFSSVGGREEEELEGQRALQFAERVHFLFSTLLQSAHVRQLFEEETPRVPLLTGGGDSLQFPYKGLEGRGYTDAFPLQAQVPPRPLPTTHGSLASLLSSMTDAILVFTDGPERQTQTQMMASPSSRSTLLPLTLTPQSIALLPSTALPVRVVSSASSAASAQGVQTCPPPLLLEGQLRTIVNLLSPLPPVRGPVDAGGNPIPLLGGEFVGRAAVRSEQIEADVLSLWYHPCEDALLAFLEVQLQSLELSVGRLTRSDSARGGDAAAAFGAPLLSAGASPDGQEAPGSSTLMSETVIRAVSDLEGLCAAALGDLKWRGGGARAPSGTMVGETERLAALRFAFTRMGGLALCGFSRSGLEGRGNSVDPLRFLLSLSERLVQVHTAVFGFRRVRREEENLIGMTGFVSHGRQGLGGGSELTEMLFVTKRAVSSLALRLLLRISRSGQSLLLLSQGVEGGSGSLWAAEWLRTLSECRQDRVFSGGKVREETQGNGREVKGNSAAARLMQMCRVALLCIGWLGARRETAMMEEICKSGGAVLVPTGEGWGAEKENVGEMPNGKAGVMGEEYEEEGGFQGDSGKRLSESERQRRGAVAAVRTAQQWEPFLTETAAFAASVFLQCSRLSGCLQALTRQIESEGTGNLLRLLNQNSNSRRSEGDSQGTNSLSRDIARMPTSVSDLGMCSAGVQKLWKLSLRLLSSCLCLQVLVTRTLEVHQQSPSVSVSAQQHRQRGGREREGVTVGRHGGQVVPPQVFLSPGTLALDGLLVKLRAESETLEEAVRTNRGGPGGMGGSALRGDGAHHPLRTHARALALIKGATATLLFRLGRGGAEG
uniref:Uncharacterized protein n=1 Tax=Chromera velia CCMP2878 TaxID=1169474 RepID=A0A0G4FLP6_9ALVE|eukprot:Cvel_17565.t1-p1 / transcript=Cvel_17565.t1 / gene=Cvel_17565 / organism=Chromera_velia_CCMP2878 / gene_product=hypothetical protein / transcript_product=hypothetical protein / location=Cvel_scaffold1411:1012-17239(+) / protein_length=3317 / sequence_SO=supercontig / SO=protein_coding / is_pseudo=false